MNDLSDPGDGRPAPTEAIADPEATGSTGSDAPVLGTTPLWPGHDGHTGHDEHSGHDEQLGPAAATGLLAVDGDAGARVADIVDRARERNLDRAEELAGWVSAAEQGELTTDGRLVAAEVAHQLAGSAGTFGYQLATDRAREIENIFTEDQPVDAWERAADCVQDLVRRLHEPPEGGPTS